MKHKILILLLALFAFVLIGCKDPKPSVPTEFNALGGWIDGGDQVYTLTTNTAEKLAFSYNKGNHQDAYLESAEIKENLSGMKKLVITVKGMATLKVQLIAGTETKEVSLNVFPTVQSYEWNLIDDSEFLKNVEKIRIFAAPGKTGSTGNAEISELKFYNKEADNYIIQTGFNNIPDNVNEYDGTSETFNFNSKWERFTPTEEVYTIEVVGNVTKVTVEKTAGAEWSCIQSLVKGDFSKFNYVVAKVKGTAGQPFILKALNKPQKETQVTLTGEEQYIAVDISGLTSEEKNSISAIFMFGYAGLGAGSGYFEIIEAFMTEEWDTGIVKNVYDGTSDTFSLVNWYDAGDNVYTITNGDETVINYTKGKDQAWSRAETYIQGDISRFGKISIEITGEAGKKVMFKIEAAGGNIEKQVELDGTRQTVDMIIHTLSVSVLKKVEKVMVFAAPGEAEVSGTFTIHSLTFMDDTLDVTSDFEDNGTNSYTITENEDGTLTVNYDKAEGNEWAWLIANYGEDSRFNTITVVLRGTAGKKILIKPNDDGNIQKEFEFEEGKDVTYTVSANKITKCLIFAEGGNVAIGSFTIVSVELSYVRPQGKKAETEANTGWVDGGDNVYTITNNDDGTVTVDYVKGEGQTYPHMKQLFKDDLAGYNTITMVLRGTAGKSILLKTNDKIENTVTFEEGKDVEFTITVDDLVSMIIMAEAGTDKVSGSFTIVETKLSCKADVTKGWVDGGDNVYTITNNDDGTVTVDYVKGEGLTYPHMKQLFKDDLAGYNTITMVLRGTAGKSILLKTNDKVEDTVTFEEGKDVEFTKTVDEVLSMIIMAEAGTDKVSGSFTIVSAILSYVEAE